LRLAVILLVVIAAASVVGIVLPQAESFQAADYINSRLRPGSDRALTGEGFLRLARSAGVGLGREGLEAFLDRAEAGDFTESEQRELFPRAAVPIGEAMEMADHEWRQAYADFSRRAAQGALTEAERARLARAAFVERARARQADASVLRLFYVDSYGPFIGGWLVRLGMHHAFRSLWFRGLCLLLVVNLAVCSLRRIPRQWRLAVGTRPGEEEGWYTRRGTHASVSLSAPPTAAAEHAEEALRRHGFRVSQRGRGEAVRLEAHRGWLGAGGRLWKPLGRLVGLGRLGSNVVHLGVVLIVIGGFVSGRLTFRHGQWGTRGDVIVVPDVSYRLSVGDQLARLWHDAKGWFVPGAEPPAPTEQERAALAADWRQNGEPPPKVAFRLRVDRFEVRFDTRGKPEYYGCHVTVLDTDPPLKHVIEVNRPLVYRGFYVYQQSHSSDYSRLDAVNLLVEKVRRDEAAAEDAHGQSNVAEVLARYAVRARPEETAQVPDTGVTVQVLRYFPHWQIPLNRDAEGNVMAGEARNLSDQPHNPAVEVLLKAPGREPKRRWMPLPPPRGRQREPFSLDYGDFRVTATSFDPVRITGLTFKTHPVLWPVWLGCGVMMLGICLCFYANHERVWAMVRPAGEGSELFLAGNAFKWRDRFRERFETVVAEIDPTTKDDGA
jgi:cytochrome c biogenesis protein